MDFEVLVSKDMPGCTTTLDKILYIIDHSNVNSTNLNETIPLTKTEQVQPKLTNKTIEDNSSKYDASITRKTTNQHIVKHMLRDIVYNNALRYNQFNC